MTAHLLLLCHAATPSARLGAFPRDDEPLAPEAAAALVALKGRAPYADRRLVSPLRRALQTAAALGLDATAEPALTDLDCGRWRGLSLAQAQARDPEAAAAWLADPACAPPGGESLDALIARLRPWLAARAEGQGITLALTHAAVVRAAIVAALDLDPRAFWRLDVAPLALARLSGRAGRWNLVGLAPLASL